MNAENSVSEFLASALKAAGMGFHVFPIVPKTKIPPKGIHFKQEATRDPEKIKKWWSNGHADSNIGISTTRFNESEALIVIDIDNKGEKRGFEELLRLEIRDGLVFPPTLETTTPSGGRHLFYKTKSAVKQGVNVLGPGIDIRSRGGYVVGFNSVLGNGKYTLADGEIAEAPEWLVQRCGDGSNRRDDNTDGAGGERKAIAVDQKHAIERARLYLESNEAPRSIKGAGGDQAAFAVAAKIKDFGVNKDTCLELMLDSKWHEESPPGWAPDKLKKKIENAYKYGENPQGAIAPEAEFKKIAEDIEKKEDEKRLGPIEELNKEFAFVVLGGKSAIIHETKNGVEFITLEAFHNVLASKTLSYSDKNMPLSREWLKSPKRRSYSGVNFYPGTSPDQPNHYNLWRGFIEDKNQLTERGQKAFDSFLMHIKENVCGGDEALNHWLLNFCAHILQFPEVKPLVALVFRGEKGVGKNFFVDQIGNLFKRNYLVTADDRYLTSNFNGHLEGCLMMVLDEAFWSGNKKADGILKNLITERYHLVERKGREAYRSQNFARICVLGNSDWLIPASNDERRFAVFDVGNAKKQDTKFFSEIRQGMEKDGGMGLLKSFLMAFEVDQELINVAPYTKGLADQKEASLHPVHAWWLECLTAGEIVGDLSSTGEWPEVMEKNRMLDSFRRYIKGRNIGGWNVDSRGFGKLLKKCLVNLRTSDKITVEGRRFNVYGLPSIEKCRKQWSVWSRTPDTFSSSDTLPDILS